MSLGLGAGDWARWGRGGRAGPHSWVSSLVPTYKLYCSQTPLTNSEESLDFSESLEQVQATEGWSWEGRQPEGFRAPGSCGLPPAKASTERVLRAGRHLHRHLLATCPTLIRDRKYHLRLYR